MKRNLSDYFEGVAAKRLSLVESDPATSNQHELNGINNFKSILGEVRSKFNTNYFYLSDDIEDTLYSTGLTTWYDARENHPTRSEWRMYFESNDVTTNFRENDLLVIGKLKNENTVIIITAENGSTILEQLLWLFGINDPKGGKVVQKINTNDRSIGFITTMILETIGIEVETDTTDLDELIDRFNGQFPTTREFSFFARSKVTGVDPISHPDDTVIAWLEKEEQLFRALEKTLLAEQLKTGFIDNNCEPEVDKFIQYSLSVQNRRKSRAGHSFEHHLQQIFELHSLEYEKGVITEGKSKPDFLFPSRKCYLDLSYPSDRLAMLGAKASCKERWRQVLDEANRIDSKHLITLEPGISELQTSAMKERDLQLIVPESIHCTYKVNQQEWLWTLHQFIDHVRSL